MLGDLTTHPCATREGPCSVRDPSEVAASHGFLKERVRLTLFLFLPHRSFWTSASASTLICAACPVGPSLSPKPPYSPRPRGRPAARTPHTPLSPGWGAPRNSSKSSGLQTGSSLPPLQSTTPHPVVIGVHYTHPHLEAIGAPGGPQTTTVLCTPGFSKPWRPPPKAPWL